MDVDADEDEVFGFELELMEYEEDCKDDEEDADPEIEPVPIFEEMAEDEDANVMLSMGPSMDDVMADKLCLDFGPPDTFK